MQSPPTAQELKDFKEYNAFEEVMVKKESLKRVLIETNEVPTNDWDTIKTSKWNITDTSYSEQELLSHDGKGIFCFLVKCSSGRVLMGMFEKVV